MDNMNQLGLSSGNLCKNESGLALCKCLNILESTERTSSNFI